MGHGDPRDPKGAQRDPRGPKGAFGALGGNGPMGPFGGYSEAISNGKQFRMEGHFDWKAILNGRAFGMEINENSVKMIVRSVWAVGAKWGKAISRDSVTRNGTKWYQT